MFNLIFELGWQQAEVFCLLFLIIFNKFVKTVWTVTKKPCFLLLLWNYTSILIKSMERKKHITGQVLIVYPIKQSLLTVYTRLSSTFQWIECFLSQIGLSRLEKNLVFDSFCEVKVFKTQLSLYFIAYLGCPLQSVNSSDFTLFKYKKRW